MKTKNIQPYIEKARVLTIKWVAIAEKHFVKLLPKNIKATLHNDTFSKEGIERLVSVSLDFFVSFILFFFPVGGWLIALAYFVLRDALPIYRGQSVGKHYFGIRVVHKGNLKSIGRNYKISAIRGIVLLIPFLNLYDIYYYLTRGERLVDQWTKTTVINERYFIPSDKNGSEI